jgi:hypothetical protein
MRLELRTAMLFAAALAAAILPAAAQPAPAPAGPGGDGAAAGGAHETLGALGSPGSNGQGDGATSAGASEQGSAVKRVMPALFGPYATSRESSGTSWQPESSPHEGLYQQHDAWDTTLRGQVFLVYDDQEGPRGALQWFSENWASEAATRQLGPGRLGLRAMVSLEPWTIGRDGYPLLLQTGETAGGSRALVDRQHSQDLLDELAATYSIDLGRASSLFAYLGLPGEPALGPPAYMYRFSAMDNPEAPLSHHWLDSTAGTFGVVSLGAVLGTLKLEGSAFNGREPDQVRTNVEESPTLDSYSFRATLEPDPGLAVQASFGNLKSPEELAPNVDVVRSTVSVMYNAPIAEAGNLQTTLAWGRNQRHPGRTTNAYLWEGEASFFTRHNVFYRVEELENDELIPDIVHFDLASSPLAFVGTPSLAPVAVITKVGGGYVYDFLVGEAYRTGAGFDVSVVHIPSRLESLYGGDWVPGWMLFLRFRIGSAAM